MRLRETFLFCASIVLGGGPTVAQPVITVHRSIELRVAQAEFVVRGTIAHLARTVVVPPDGYVTNSVRIDGEERSYRTEMPDGKVTYAITVKVDEVIKGPRRATAEFVVESSARDDEFERWAARRASFLCFGNPSERTNNETMPPYWNAISLDPPVPGEQTIGGMVDFPPIFSMDFTRLDDPREIVSRARKFRNEKSLKTHVFDYPPLFPELLWARLAVPVTPSLEGTARHLLNSPKDFLRRTQPPIRVKGREDMLRADGIAALRYFKSRQNIKLLTRLLDDPAFMITHSRDDRSDARRIYYIRKAAHEVLLEWGVNGARLPLFEENISPSDGAGVPPR